MKEILVLEDLKKKMQILIRLDILRLETEKNEAKLVEKSVKFGRS